MAKQLGYADYASMKEQAAKGKTLINGASINTQLIDTDLLITSLVIAKAIKTSNLNVNDKFIVKTDGSVDMNGIFHSLGTKTELVISNGYLRIAYNGEEIMRFAVNQNTGMPELNMHKGDKSVFISPEKLVFGFGSGNNFLTLNPSDIGGGDVRKKSDGTLYVTTGETSLITVGIYVSPQVRQSLHRDLCCSNTRESRSTWRLYPTMGMSSPDGAMVAPNAIWLHGMSQARG